MKPDNHDGVITHLEPDILECKVKWALESITMNKASGGDGVPTELFQILRDGAVKVLYSICQQIWKTQQWPQDWKRSVFIPTPNKSYAKEYSNSVQFSSIHFSHSVVSDSFWPHELQHTRLPYPSPVPRVYPNSCPLSQWCHPAISYLHNIGLISYTNKVMLKIL